MQSQKKHSLLEGLIQAALLLSLCGVRLDVELEPGPSQWSQSLLLGPTSALTPTHLHNLRNVLEGGPELHPKHPDLDGFFTSRRLLGWMRSLDRLQVPQAEVETWLVQQDPAPLPVRLLHTTPNRLILLEQTRDQEWTQPGEETRDQEWTQPGMETRDQEWEEPEGINTQVYRQHVDTEDMSPPLHMETQGTEEWDLEETEDRGQAEDEQSSASLQECLRLLEAFPLTQEQQELVCNSGPYSTALPPVHSAPADMEQQWQDLMDLMEPQAGDVEMVALLEHRSQVTSSAEQGGPLMDNYLQHGPAQDLLPLVPSDQLDDPSPPPSPSPLLPPAHSSSLLLDEQDLGADLEELLGDADMLQEMSLLDLALEEEGFGEDLSERLEEYGYLDPEQTHRSGQSRLLSEDRSMEDRENDFHVILPDVDKELDSDSGLSLDPPSPSHSETSSYSSSSSSSTSQPSPMEPEITIKEEPLDEEELGAVGGHYPPHTHPDRDSKLIFSTPFHPDQKLFPWFDQISHDHTYNQPSAMSSKTSSKHLKPSSKLERHYQLPKHLWSRDDRRARALKIPFSNELIINLPVEEFNDLLANYHLDEEQLNLVRDIRRRGKNKIAAQNCRKRKMDTLQGLEKDVTMLRRRRARLLKDKQEAFRNLQELKQRLTSLYQGVFSSLRDEEGRPLDVHEYMLSFENDGRVDVVSRRQRSKEKRRRQQKDRK